MLVSQKMTLPEAIEIGCHSPEIILSIDKKQYSDFLSE